MKSGRGIRPERKNKFMTEKTSIDKRSESGFVVIILVIFVAIILGFLLLFMSLGGFGGGQSTDGTSTPGDDSLGYSDSTMVNAPAGCVIFAGKGCLGANTPAFDRKNIFVAQQLGIPDPNFLKAIYKAESAILCNPGWFDKKRGVWGAAGIIQFIPSTARNMFSVSNSIFITMPAVNQLDYAYRYLRQSGCSPGRCRNLLDTYLVIHAPARCRFKGENHICYSRGSVEYENGGNRVLDTNKDGHVTNKEIGLFAFRAYRDGAGKCR
jgi:hypothetical protein